MTDVMDPANWQSQVEELQALESIFEQNFSITNVSGLAMPRPPEGWTAAALAAAEEPSSSLSWTISCQIAVYLDPPASGFWEISIPNSPSSPDQQQHVHDWPSHQLKHLPPIILSIDFPASYPSANPPQFQVASMWLSHRQSIELESQLDALWDAQGPGLPVVWTWTDWLQNSSMDYLQNTSGTASKSFFVLESDPPQSVSSTDDADQEESLRDDEDALPEQQYNVENKLIALLRYAAARELQLFREGMHTCGICFEEHRGDKFERLDCHHTFCRDCLTEQARVNVKEGSLDALKCPEPGCKEPFAPHVLRRLLDGDAFERWEQLTLQRALDSMPDAAYCPRCGSLSLEDVEDNTADCPKCLFVFCTLCNEGRHPGVQCVSAETRLAMLRKKAEGGGAAAVAELRRKEHEMMSLSEIEKSSKPCPACGMAIQRTEGCNKMICGNCSAFFCYKCGKQITGYEHFKAGGSCVLFDEAEILRFERRWEEQVGAHAAAQFRNDYFMEFGDDGFGFDGGAGAGGGDGNAGRRRRAGADNNRGPAPVTNCPCCGQPNYRFARNNHLQCWSCTRHFCALCKTVLQRRGGRTHFGPSGCPQHS